MSTDFALSMASSIFLTRSISYFGLNGKGSQRKTSCVRYILAGCLFEEKQADEEEDKGGGTWMCML